MLMDISSEMIHSLLPLFMVTTLGSSVFAVGLLEGLAEATALVVKVFSGTLSDYLGRRKGLALIGYGLGAVSKPLFALSGGFGLVASARLLDRVGKGIRGAPRDALVADLTPQNIRGAAFGLRQSLDTVGALLGPLIAVGLMVIWSDDFRAVFRVATVPAFLAVFLLYIGIREPRVTANRTPLNPFSRQQFIRLSPAYRWVVALGAAFTLARFSEAFLVLRAQQSGIPTAFVPLVMVAMSLVYSVTAYPFGRLSDTMSHGRLLGASLLVLVVADLFLARASNLAGLFVGIGLWGVHMGMSQGLLATMVADSAPDDLRGTAYGFFNLISGAAMLLASVLAGLLWESVGYSATFYAGAGFCVLAFGLLCARRVWSPQRFAR